MTKKKKDDNESNKTDLEDIKKKLEELKSKTEIPDVKLGIVAKNVDPFNDLKLHILNILDETRKCIREKENTQKFYGNNMEVIKRGNIIYNNMKNVDVYFTKLEEILNKQLKQKHLFNQEELCDKNETFDLLKKQIYECKKLSNYNEIKYAAPMDFNEFKNKPNLERKEMSDITHDEDDLIIINRWKERDKQFNEEILQIGEVIDKIGDNAVTITQKAEQQNEIILNLQDQTDKAHDNVKEANIEIKKVMIKQTQATWCCRISLIITLLILIVLTLSIISNKFIKNL
ncbi:conserved Plasmodium protein, unknown function [Plasmodium gallinaceum]|uniref:t-SNARE coiled-coil homology domain-containing protein n=1 Tax=Plasmodium gallinaceum TaxID=5849 RepID=A0A1J1GSY9_PLAGA|nr:conserved Plasmodium protein, unknown function [Plasmodium gallinaceum]CRG95594.1 conserved Plasmodium protein, unknown function [Plasmodium gallinaceum]